jgi:hypothetical protein
MRLSNNERRVFGIPTKDEVDYDKVYKFSGMSSREAKTMFEIYEANRGGMDELDAPMKRHIKYLKSVFINDNNVLPEIIVDINTLRIAEGNSRYMALIECLEDGVEGVFIKVRFEDIPEDEFDQRVMDYNTHRKSWTTANYLGSYVKRDIGSYKEFVDFCKSNPMIDGSKGYNPRDGIAALGQSSTKLSDGTLELTKEDFERGKKVFAVANEISKHFEKKDSNCLVRKEGFLGGISDAFIAYPNIDPSTFVDIVKGKQGNVRPPLGSNKKTDWSQYFQAMAGRCLTPTGRPKRTNKKSSISEMSGCVGVGVTAEELEEAASEPSYVREIR